MADITQTETKVQYSQRVTGSRMAEDDATQLQERSLTNEQSGTNNQTSKSQETAQTTEATTRTGSATGKTVDASTGASTTRRESIGSRAQQTNSLGSVTRAERVNIGLMISFRVPIKGKFPTEGGANTTC